MAKTFTAGDKVFAKVRGYPAWPARVEGVADATPNKTKYHVFFYGTSETAVCKVEDLYHYAENKEKYGRPLKRKGFNEALAQIEGLAPVPQKPHGGDSKAEDADSDAEGNLVIDESPAVATGAGGSAARPEDVKKKALKRKRESEVGAEDSRNGGVPYGAATGGGSMRKRSGYPLPKRAKRDSPASAAGGATGGTPGGSDNGSRLLDTTASSSPASPPKPEIVSRSGRKIKPKKFADEETFDSGVTSPGEGGVPVAKGGLGPEPAGGKRRQSAAARSGDGEGDKAWEAQAQALSGSAARVKAQLEAGEGVPEQVQAQLDGQKARRQQEQHVATWGKVVERRRSRLKWLKIEARMVEVDALIKGHLSLRRACPEQCLKLLDELCGLLLDPLMLKKHPQVVETIKRLRKYIGNTREWGYSEEEMVKFSSKAHQIRSKAEYIYNKFKAMFTVPEGRTFWQVFSDDVSAFQRTTQHLAVDKLFALVVDPTGRILHASAGRNARRRRSPHAATPPPLPVSPATTPSKQRTSGDRDEEEREEEGNNASGAAEEDGSGGDSGCE